MNPGDEVLLDIESMSLSGDGIAKKDGLVYFVTGALRGEEVNARVTKVEHNLIRAQTMTILKPSPDRETPKCPHFGTCGGCSFQHLRYEKQLDEKRDALMGLFRHLGDFSDISIEPVLASPKPYHYRNAVAMTVKRRKDGPHFGFVARDNRTFIPIEQCPIADERINQSFPLVKQKFLTLLPEKKQSHTSQISIRIGQEDGLYTSIKEKPQTILSARVLEKTLSYAGSAFFQVNYSLLEKMAAVVRDFLQPTKRHELIDIYSGAGLFSIALGDLYGQVIGIEEGYEAVASARKNAAENHQTNIQFMEGRAEDVLPKLSLPLGVKRHVVVDPPRVGMKPEVVEVLVRAEQIEKLVYVSCNPATLVRDLKMLRQRYDIKTVQPLDMFPQTQHLETIVLLLPRSGEEV